MMNRLDNKGQVLVMFICLLPIVLLIIGAVVDISSMVIEKNKLSNINEIVSNYYMEHKNDDDITLKITSLVKKNDDDIVNIKVDRKNNTIYLDKKIESTMGKIIGIREYEIVSEYGISNNGIKRIR